ncbi:MAG: hypothetical protein ACC700_13955, partial [Anaerolineales bacterium]
DALSTMLQVKAEEFAAADMQSESGFAGLQRSLRDWLQRAFGDGPLSAMAGVLGLGWILDGGDDEGEGDDEEDLPWWAPWALQAANRWHGFDQRYGQPLREALEAIPSTWEGIGADAKTIALYSTAQGWLWYDRTVKEPLSDLHGKFLALQGPGLSPNDPITLSLTQMAAVDSSGNPISPVASELVDLVDGLGVRVAFIGTGAGVSPWVGQIVIPEKYVGSGQVSGSTVIIETGRIGLVAHELTHAAHRELNNPAYAPAVIDSTNHMEVVAYIAGETVQYDLLGAELQDPTLTPDERQAIEDKRLDLATDIATYTDSDQLNANRYVVKEHTGTFIYQLNHFKESLIPGNRIPPGGWEESFRSIGFSDQVIEHIKGIPAANNVSAVIVNPEEIGLFGEVRTPTAPQPSTPTPIPTPTPNTPAPSPSTAPSPSPSPTPTPNSHDGGP